MKKTLLKILGISLITFITHTTTFAQGCVAIRSTGGLCAMDEHPDSALKNGQWLFNSNGRYYQSGRHFVGKQEQFQRATLQNNVINTVESDDNTITRIFNDRWSVSATLPFVVNRRSQLAGTTRFSTRSAGVGDIRAAAYYWLLDPAKVHNFNIQLGLGIKLPTGDHNAQDYFLQADGTTRILGPVDQSIQLGDGGTGYTLELNTFYNVSHTFGFYGNFFYLSSPEDVNGTATSATTPSATKVAITSNVESVPDQMLIRVGASFSVKKFDFTVGLRDDCLPVRDLIGESDGFRRPGYILSAEPGATYRLKKNIAIYAFVPIAIIRDRTQSVPDIRQTALTGTYAHGDAAFADYVINLGITVKF